MCVLKNDPPTTCLVIVLGFFVLRLPQIISNFLFLLPPLLGEVVVWSISDYFAHRHLAVVWFYHTLGNSMVKPDVCTEFLVFILKPRRKWETLLCWRIPMYRNPTDYVISFVHLFSKRYLLKAAQGSVAPVGWFRVSEGLRTNGSSKGRVSVLFFFVIWLRYCSTMKKSKIALAKQKLL